MHTDPPDVYNLFWFTPAYATSHHPAPNSRHHRNKLTPARQIEAVILYPAFATPEIIAEKDDRLEVILLTQQEYTDFSIRRRILEQLKITKGLDPKKPAFEDNLFPPENANANKLASFIDVGVPFSLEKNTLFETKSKRFRGYIDERVFNMYRNKKFATVYIVSIDAGCLECAGGSIGEPDNSACEPQDRFMRTEVFDKRHKKLKFSKEAEQYAESGLYYSFKLDDHDVDSTHLDTTSPLQSWHPVYQFHSLEYGNVAHISDLHLSARQQILARTKARVIDYSLGGSDQDPDVSPSVGSLINICSKDVVNILDQFASSDAHFLAIGGDVVDFLQNCFLSGELSRKLKNGRPTGIWAAVSLAGDVAAKAEVPLEDTPNANCVDFIAFYSILLRFCRYSKMPVFLISGNHDSYWYPYGMSPRAIARKPGDKWYEGSGKGLRRANEGIPADHNLTFYEAILAFGESYNEVKAPVPLKTTWSPFLAEAFDWFYAVFTPFTDYAIRLPKQHLCAFGWGDDEHLFDTPFTGHGFGHLPRANTAISKDQLGLLTTATADSSRKTILLTHFTFVSYQDDIPTSEGESKPGQVYFGLTKGYEEHNLGTFEDSREPVLGTHCYQNRDIQIILTGHSHRRGLYLIDSVDERYKGIGRTCVNTLHFDFHQFGQLKEKYGPEKLKPAIVVSDSGATIPRYNEGGEFSGWGSDQPSGTKITFDASGEIKDIHAVRAKTCHPRIAVAIDYLDVYHFSKVGEKDLYIFEKRVIESFESDEFDLELEKSGGLDKLIFNVQLNDEISSLGIYIEQLWFYAKASSENWDWHKIELLSLDAEELNIHDASLEIVIQSERAFAILGADNVAMFRDSMSQNQERGNFMAIKLGRIKGLDRHHALQRYSFKEPWCFEFQVNFETFGKILLWAPKTKKYIIERDKTRAEIPSFQWRRSFVPERYA